MLGAALLFAAVLWWKDVLNCWDKVY